MKKILNIIITLMMIIIVMPVGVIAEENNIDWSIYTEEERELIAEMIETNPEFDITEGEVVYIGQIAGPLITDDLSTRGIIDPNGMRMTLTVQRINSSVTTYDAFKFQLKADWIIAPVFRMKDAVGIAWSDDFTQYLHSCNAYYNSVGMLSGKTHLISSVPESGVAYTVEASDYYGQALDYVILSVYVRKYNSTGTAAVEGKYAHSIVDFWPEFSVSFGGGSVGFSSSGSYDYMVKDASFNY